MSTRRALADLRAEVATLRREVSNQRDRLDHLHNVVDAKPEPTPRQIVARNPLPADIDWKLVEDTLGLKISALKPSALDLLTEIRDLLAGQASPDGAGPLLARGASVVCDDDRDGVGDEQVVDDLIAGDDFGPWLGRALVRITDALEQGRDVLVLTQPNLVSAIRELLDHGFSPSSMVGTSEATSAAGSVSADSAAPSSEQERESHRRISAANERIDELREQSDALARALAPTLAWRSAR